MSEAAITINGIPLTVAQSMAVRVAVTHFHAQTAVSGDAIDKAYHARLSEVLKAMLAP